MPIPVIPLPKKIEFFEDLCKNTSPCFSEDSALPKEGYRIEITDCVTVFYATPQGRKYAENTLAQLMRVCGENIPQMIIEDYPDFSYRGLMLDVGRYFFGVEDVCALLDRMSDLKLNVFHFHLTEDQGWRVQSDKYPRLTEVGAYRKRTNFSCRKHGGFYTKDDLKQIVAHAHKRGICVVPEIDVPGHCRAALAAYPELGCLGRRLSVATHWGVKHDILCAGKESTFWFLDEIISEFCEIFTDGYFHLGGDEAVKMRWKLCPHCQRRIEEEGLSSEDELQTYLLNRVYRETLAPRGIRPIVWINGEIPQGLDDAFVIEWYGGEFTDEQRERAGNKTIINADSEYFYYDYPYAMNTLQKSFSAESQGNFGKNLRGVEASVWTEYIKDAKTAEYKTFPRLLAGAEKMWGTTVDYEDFEQRAIAYYGKTDSKNFCPLEKANRDDKQFFRTFFWKCIRPLHWEGLHNLLDDAKAARLFRKQENNAKKANKPE